MVAQRLYQRADLMVTFQSGCAFRFFSFSLRRPHSLNSSSMTRETLQKKGYIDVAENRESKPVNIYYEMHGTGPEKVLLVMGTFVQSIDDAPIIPKLKYTYYYCFLIGLSTPCSAWDFQVLQTFFHSKSLQIFFLNAVPAGGLFSGIRQVHGCHI